MVQRLFPRAAIVRASEAPTSQENLMDSGLYAIEHPVVANSQSYDGLDEFVVEVIRGVDSRCAGSRPIWCTR